MRRKRPFNDPIRRTPVVRRLQFDSLEDRKLLAGLNVFVFEDGDGSGTHSADEMGAADRVLFLDQDRDGVLDSNESWTKTDADGRARFDSLPDGDYWPTLFGRNQSTLATNHVAPARSTVLHPSIDAKQVLGWQTEQSLWIATSHSIDLIDASSQGIIDSIRLDQRIIDVALDPQSSTAFAILESAEMERSLVSIQLNSHTTQAVDNTFGLGWRSIHKTSSAFLARLQDGPTTTSLVQLNATTLAWNWVENSRQSIDAQYLASPSSNDLLVVVPSTIGSGSSSSSGAASELQRIELQDQKIWIRQARTWNSPIRSMQLDATASHYLIADAQGWSVLAPNLNSLYQLPNPNASVVYDALRQTLFAMDTDRGQATVTSIADGREIASVPFQGFEQMGTMFVNPSRTVAYGLSANGLFSLGLTEAVSPQIRLVQNHEFASVAFGVKTTRSNALPRFSAPSQLDVLEDDAIGIGLRDPRLQLQDVDRDLVGLFVVDPPKHGKLAWSLTDGGVYTPNSNYEGRDSIVVQAFDGAGWSAPVTLGLNILGVNDIPSGIHTDLAAVPENITPGSAIGVVTVLDPDRDASYRVTVDDSRLLVIDGVLQLAAGAHLDYESEPSITFVITAADLSHPEDVVTQTITLDVRDQNDPPQRIDSQSHPISENEIGIAVASLRVVDGENRDTYRWIVSDARFVVIDQGLYLAPGVSLNYEETPSIDVVLTAIDADGNQVSKTIHVEVVDTNDPPMSLTLDQNEVVGEVPGYRIGSIRIEDEDQAERYEYSVSDPRFVVVGNQLQLRPTESLPFSENPIQIRVMARSVLDGTTIERPITIHVVESRSPHQNPIDPLDVDGDGIVTPRDPLILINHLNRHGPGRINAPAPGDGEPGYYFDVNGDGVITPLDIIIILNHLNRFGVVQSGSPDHDTRTGQGEGEGALTSELHDMSLTSYLAEQQVRDLQPRYRKR